MGSWSRPQVLSRHLHKVLDMFLMGLIEVVNTQRMLTRVRVVVCYQTAAYSIVLCRKA